jgi:hypothetical protein
VVGRLGDGVGGGPARDALLSLLGGTIDSQAEATLLAAFDGRELLCAAPSAGPGTQTRPADDGYDLQTISSGLCAGIPGHGSAVKLIEALHVAADGTLTQTEGEPTTVALRPACTGRRPAGLCARVAGNAGSALGEFFADAARLEAASVVAFKRLADELAALGAPSQLIAAAWRSALEEVRHARLVGALALRCGARLSAPVIAPAQARTCFALALENAVEGCVRETYGALLAHCQAEAALDPEVRQVMRVLARDETRHALLAWQIAAFLAPRLSAREQQALALARSAAFAQLIREQDCGLAANDRKRIGLPDAATSELLLARLRLELGSA